jgi:bifunctional DNA-binding transcriptional regulator/antitoxin component of YhaV-PrlF toxin-antitoxin module
MLNSTIIQAVNDGYQVVLPALVKKELKIEVKYYNLTITSTNEVKDKDKLIFLRWEEANEFERLSWKKFLL